MIFTQQERDSPLWGKIKAHLGERIDTLRAQNDHVSNDERVTAMLRGQIKEAKALLALGDEKPEFKRVEKPNTY